MKAFPRIVCRTCGATSVRGLNYSRDYPPVVARIRLKPETATTYIITPELACLTVRILSTDAGKINYAIHVPLDDFHAAMRILNADDRIAEWHTEPTDDLCAEHLAGMEWSYLSDGSPYCLKPAGQTER